ncbi:SHOCT domain-containing protein [Curtobacterium sp. RRHDQ10]|uniref:SHOCT domain-containing protein n=1 Tax=Curtobacterium phyllosphaerae TaxID=3413379 RepID=UPI003BF0B151
MFTTLAASPLVVTAAGTAQHWHGGPGFGPGPFLFPLFFLVVLVALFLVFGVVRRGSWRARSDARSVLADRFARGEVDAEEYRARLSELSRK